VESINAAITPAPLSIALKESLPEFSDAVRLSMLESHLFSVGKQRYEEDRVLYADSNFFDIFSFPLAQGDSRLALLQPQSIVLTRAMAIKYFGQEDVLGQTIQLDNKDNFTITGVLAKQPQVSHLDFDFLMPMRYLARTNEDISGSRWDNFNFYNYVKTQSAYPSNNFQNLAYKIDQLYQENNTEIQVHFDLQRLTDIHLKSAFLGDVPGQGNMQHVYLFSIIAILILVIASINFMNLSTARSSKRAREIGFRKVAGAKRIQLILQFLTESCLISFISLFLALLILFLSLPAFNLVTSKQIGLAHIDTTLIASIFILTLIIGLISGAYPALYLSSFSPVKVFNMQPNSGRGQRWFRDSLVITQFVFSIVLIIATIVVHRQQEFIKNQNLGFDRANLVYMHLRGNLRSEHSMLRAALDRNLLTSNYTVAGELPTNLLNATVDISWPGKDPERQDLFSQMPVDDRFIDVFEMQLAAGRNFSREHPSDEGQYILNERAIELMGIDLDKAVGQPFSLWGNSGSILGVIKDFHFKPIKQPIEPMVMRYVPEGEDGFLVIRAKPAQTEATIRVLEVISQELNPDYPFSYGFIDQDLDNLYQSEKQLGRLVNIFAFLAIFISCLGLHGLSAFIAEQRKKEISVRKVVGASTFQLSYLLSRDFTKPIWVAMIIAIPIAIYSLNSWLNTFAYHVNISSSIILISCLMAWSIAIITVSYEAIKAALLNPAATLKGDS